MNEAQRQFAMGVAGVRLWYAREPLPGAAPSPELDFPESWAPAPTEVAAEAPGPDAGIVDRDSQRGLRRLQGLLAETRREPATSRGKAEPDVPSTPATISTAPEPPPESEPHADTSGPVRADLAGERVAFHWRFWIGRSWVLVSSRSETASRGLEDNLAGNILRALKDEVESREEVRWPVFSNPAVPGNDAAGAADVLTGVAEPLGGYRVLALGLVPDGAEQALILEALAGHLGSATVPFPQTLAALASDPSAKRDLWAALKAVSVTQ